MPLIDVKCSRCDKVVEVIVKTIPPKADELEKCACGGEVKYLADVFSTSFQLKGSCWAKDGYK